MKGASGSSGNVFQEDQLRKIFSGLTFRAERLNCGCSAGQAGPGVVAGSARLPTLGESCWVEGRRVRKLLCNGTFLSYRRFRPRLNEKLPNVKPDSAAFKLLQRMLAFGGIADRHVF